MWAANVKQARAITAEMHSFTGKYTGQGVSRPCEQLASHDPDRTVSFEKALLSPI